MEKRRQASVIVLGSGRSGTSMVAGCFAHAGYFMGDRLYQPRESNPKGFFESPDINGVNELIIDTLPRDAFLFRPPFWHRWTAAVADIQGLSVSEPVRESIDILTARTPFCFKDPRFSYTLPVWRPSLKNVVYVCVFRHPAITAASIVKEVDAVRTTMGIPTRITYEQAVIAWTAMYKHILAMPCDGPEWLFVHYEQVLNGSALKKMEAATGAALDRHFPDAALSRTSPGPPIGDSEVGRVYENLCRRAGFYQ